MHNYWNPNISHLFLQMFGQITKLLKIVPGNLKIEPGTL